MKSQFLHRYCDRYAEPIAQAFAAQAASLLSRQYRYVLCVPAYDESPDFIAPLLNSVQTNVLVILVFNAPINPSNSAAQLQTQDALRSLTQSHQQLSLKHWNSKVDVLVVDCCTMGRQLPAKEGVGLARKIAGDLAVAAIAHHKIESPWIYCTDADVQLPSHYFEAIPADLKGYAAAVYPFRHLPVYNNILQYEISLRYYVLQLEARGSPYAFQTVGSCMAAHAQSYAAVRGFPKRNAAEDFYILNKLAKTGAILRINTDCLVLSSRRSHRVPFGTGAAMNRLHEEAVQLLYHPDIFVCLGQWFQQMDRLWDDRDRVQVMGLEAWWAEQTLDCDEVLATLIDQGLPKVLKQAFRQCRDRPHFRYYLHVWFDAFRTLRFVHLMRDGRWRSLSAGLRPALGHRGFPSIQIADLPSLAPHLQLHYGDLPTLNAQLKDLERSLPLRTGPTHFLET